MRPYETIVILGAEVGDKSSQLLQRLEGIITEGGGGVDVNHDWGTRKLAYPIKKQTHGHFFLIEYTAEPAAVKELERTLRITDGVLRFMSVQQEHTGLPEPRRREEAPSHESRSLSELRTPGVSPEVSPAAPPAEQANPPAGEAKPEPAVAEAEPVAAQSEPDVASDTEEKGT